MIVLFSSLIIPASLVLEVTRPTTWTDGHWPSICTATFGVSPRPAFGNPFHHRPAGWSCFSNRGTLLMDARFLGYYERELQFIRDMAGEFAREYPKVACTSPWTPLMSRTSCGAPAGGLSFLTARLYLRMDAHPRSAKPHATAVPGYLAPRPDHCRQFELARRGY